MNVENRGVEGTLFNRRPLHHGLRKFSLYHIGATRPLELNNFPNQNPNVVEMSKLFKVEIQTQTREIVKAITTAYWDSVNEAFQI